MSVSTVLKGKGMMGDERDVTDTDKFLAMKFPHLKKSWLARMNRKLGLLKQENGGNVEMIARFSLGGLKWLGWHEREDVRD